MPHDLVIRNGFVVDGSGLARYRADVGVVGDRIVQVGRIRDRGRTEIDAEGHVVTPGFIDGHTHMDAQMFWDPLGTCSSWHGVTTAVVGNCGFSLAPAGIDQRHLVVRNLERAEDISGEAMAAGIEWGWDSFRTYLDVVDGLPKAINYAANVGHSALRTWVMGERAFAGPATDDDLAAMERELGDALAAGAVGLTTSRSPNHETADGRAVASRQATWQEVVRLVAAVGAAGGGTFELAHEPASESPDPEVQDEYFERLRRLAVDTGVQVMFGVLAVGDGSAETWRKYFRLLERTAATGGRMTGQAHSRELSVLLSFKTRLPFDAVAEWARVRALPWPRQRAVLEDRDARAGLVAAAHAARYGRAIGAEARPPDYAWIRVVESMTGTNPTVAELAAATGQDPVELMIDRALARDGDLFFAQVLNNRDPAAVEAILRHPHTIMTFSDSGAHVSQIMDSSIQTHLLAEWVRERQAFTLEQAVQMITLAPAVAWGFHDRGLVRQGMVADLNVLDPDRVVPHMPRVAHDLPAGGRRLVQKADGIAATVIAGEVVLRDGAHTGALPGRLLRVRRP